MAGTRSGGEVFQHIATDNYFLPIFLGVSAPAGTNVTNDYETAVAYETRKATRAEIVADLTKSFAHVKQAILATKPEQLPSRSACSDRPSRSNRSSSSRRPTCTSISDS